MKKIALVSLAVLVVSSSAFSSIIFEAKGCYFTPFEKSFRDIYGAGWKPAGEIGIRLINRLDFWVAGAFFSRNGKLTYTEEETKLTILPVGGGFRFRFTTGRASCYASAGLNYYQYKESNPIGDVEATGVGYVGKLGAFIRIVGGLEIDLNVGYSYGRMKPADFEINIGGFEAGVGLAVEF